MEPPTGWNPELSEKSNPADDGSVVILDESEWSNIRETLRLLSDKESLTALIESHAIREKGMRPEGIGPEEAFKDV